MTTLALLGTDSLFRATPEYTQERATIANELCSVTVGELETLRPSSMPTFNVVDAYLLLLETENFIVLNTKFAHHLVYDSVAELLYFLILDAKKRLKFEVVKDIQGSCFVIHFVTLFGFPEKHYRDKL